ncbi:hypothetical protein MYU51_017433 [Penicillium brevicompactum]
MVPPARPSETQRGPSVSILFDVPRQIQTTRTKAMNSSSSQLLQELKQSLRTRLHAHAAMAAGETSLCGCLFAGNQGASVGSKIAGQGDPEAHNLHCRCRATFKQGEEWPRLKNSAKWHKTYQSCETPRNSLIVSNRHHGTIKN